jgi:DNA-directed RNA polymerase specialized sigma24 family protein
MLQADDMALLRQYASCGSEEAFAALVSRHINLVYSVALRHVASSDQAEEISQAVFMILARRASSLRDGTVLSGWLYHTARLTAANYVRGEIRRAQREREAMPPFSMDPNRTPGRRSRLSWMRQCPV